jgi:hypothetical protein
MFDGRCAQAAVPRAPVLRCCMPEQGTRRLCRLRMAVRLTAAMCRAPPAVCLHRCVMPSWVPWRAPLAAPRCKMPLAPQQAAESINGSKHRVHRLLRPLCRRLRAWCLMLAQRPLPSAPVRHPSGPPCPYRAPQRPRRRQQCRRVLQPQLPRHRRHRRLRLRRPAWRQRRRPSARAQTPRRRPLPQLAQRQLRRPRRPRVPPPQPQGP